MARTTIPAELVAVNAIQGTLIADNAITAVHIATNAISGTLVADNAITSTHIAENNVTATQIAQNTITVTQIADSAVETAKINNGAVTQAKIADDAIGPNQLADNAVVSASIANGTIVEADMADNAVTLAKMASLARGSVIVGDAAGDPAALAIGSNTYVLSSDGTDIAWAAAAGTTINNNADNRVITGSGTANTLEGEANLTFDGTTTVINNTGNADSTLLKLTNTPSTAGTYKTGIEFWSNEGTAANQTFNAGRIYSEFNGSSYSNAGLTLGSASGGGTFNDELTLRNGNVGIGTTAPSEKLHVSGGNALIQGGTGSTSVSELGFTNAFDTAFLRSSYTNPSASTETYIAFHTNASGAANGTVAEQMRIVGNKVGIGTSSPATKLDVSGTIRSLVSGGTPILYLNNGTTQHSIQNTSGALTFFNSATERMRIDSIGVVHAKAGFGTSPITSCSGFTGTAGYKYLIQPVGALEPFWAVYSGDNYKSRGKGYFRWWYGYGNAATGTNQYRCEVDLVDKNLEFYEVMVEDMAGTTYAASAPAYEWAYWSTRQKFNTQSSNTNYATSSSMSGSIEAMWGQAGGHGLYNSVIGNVCSWGNLQPANVIGAGYTGNCGTYPSTTKGVPEPYYTNCSLRLGRPYVSSASFQESTGAFSFWFNF